MKDMLTYENLEKAKDVLDPFYVTNGELLVWIIATAVISFGIGFLFGKKFGNGTI